MVSKLSVWVLVLAVGCAKSHTDPPPVATGPTTTPSTITPPEPPGMDLGPLLEPIRDQYAVPALAAATVDADGTLALGATGVRSWKEDAAVSWQDRFHLGSDTKAMTATLVARLVEEGVVAWDWTLAEALPGIEQDSGWDGVTLYQEK